MNPQSTARVILVTGWCTGMALTADGQPLTAVFAVLAAAAILAMAVRLRGARAAAWLKAYAARLASRRKQETGTAVERA